jgi:hypothetical protein
MNRAAKTIILADLAALVALVAGLAIGIYFKIGALWTSIICVAIAIICIAPIVAKEVRRKLNK